MHKIDGAGHLGHMFVMEDALINRPPTEITADFMNALQMELSNVIEWAGLELSKADNSQLLQALQAKFASINPAGDYATKTAVQFDDYKIADASVVGSANAIVAGFFPAITDLAASHGMVLYVRCLAANTTTTPTFTPNNGIIAAKTIVKGNDLPLAAGDIAGAGYWATLQYDLTLDKWVLKNPATGLQPIVPAVIDVIYVPYPTAPDGYLKANGAAVSRSAYAYLFSKIGTTFGVGDGASTFNLPDLRGEFIRGWDDFRGINPARTLGSFEDDMFENHNHILHFAMDRAPVTSGNAVFGDEPTYGFVDMGSSYVGGSETRPRNIALLACIRYLG